MKPPTRLLLLLAGRGEVKGGGARRVAAWRSVWGDVFFYLHIRTREARNLGRFAGQEFRVLFPLVDEIGLKTDLCKSVFDPDRNPENVASPVNNR